jgi:hypothetical protein
VTAVAAFAEAAGPATTNEAPFRSIERRRSGPRGLLRGRGAGSATRQAMANTGFLEDLADTWSPDQGGASVENKRMAPPTAHISHGSW